MPKKPTQRDCILAALKQHPYGGRIEEAASRKYVKVVLADGVVLWIGKAGALRRGQTITGSVPVNDRIRQMVLNVGRELLGGDQQC